MIFAPATETVSWGRVTRPLQEVATPAFPDEVAPALAARGEGTVLPVGLRRSYGDSNLNSGGRLIDLSRMTRMIAFDPASGVLRADAGVSLGEVLRLVVPRGWFLSTTPGSRFVTLGGAVANDVHGKNHHRVGTFSRSVRRIGLLRSDRGLCEIGPDDPTGLFAATVGGLGLTGIITFVELQLVRIATSQLDVERIPFTSTREFFTLARESTAGHEHTVAWIDCVTKGAPGRGIFQRANWSAAGPLVAHRDRALATLPIDAPGFALNALTVGLFNALYYRLQAAGARYQVQHYAPFFYPLDSLRQWNRLYGRRGFYQYQCVIPPAAAEPAIEALVQAIVSSGAGSFLAVIKTFGAEPSCGVLSFPREGATLALDFANRGQPTLDLLARLDAIVAEAGGALYPAKDGRMPAQMFRASYPNVDKFTPYIDPAISSDFWRRVQL